MIVFSTVLVGLLPLIDRKLARDPEVSEEPASPAALFRQIEEDLAKGDRFYLLLDPPAHSLRLMLKGAFLEEFPVDEVLVGTPRVFFFPSESGSDWDLRVWTDGRLDPPREQKRIEVTPPDSALALDSLQPALPVPPPPEEAYHVPPIYRILYPGGLTLVVESPPDSTGQGIPSRFEVARSRAMERLQEFNASLARESVRVRLRMRAETAQRLYRSLPSEACFLLAPGSASDEPTKPTKPARGR